MKRFQLCFTTAVMLSLPGLVFGQATGGSSGAKVNDGGKKVIPPKKGAAHPELAKKGAANTPKITGNGNAPKVETPIGSATGGAGSGRAGKLSEDTGRKKVEPTASARKKPPRPRPAKPPDPQ